MEEVVVIKFLKSFFNLFNAKIENYKIVDKGIFGTVCWLNEDEGQDFYFKEKFHPSVLYNVMVLCDFIFENKLVDGDRIIISETEMLQKLKYQKWNEEEAKEAINNLCDIEVKMLDEGEETDSFFIHF